MNKPNSDDDRDAAEGQAIRQRGEDALQAARDVPAEDFADWYTGNPQAFADCAVAGLVNSFLQVMSEKLQAATEALQVEAAQQELDERRGGKLDG